MAKIKNSSTPNAGVDTEKLDHSSIAVEMWIGTATLGSSSLTELL